MKNILSGILFVLSVVTILTSCKKDDFQSLYVWTTDVSEISASSAKISGKISVSGKADILPAGFCWDTTPGFYHLNNAITVPDAEGAYKNEQKEFSGVITGLTPSTTYYVKSFATYNGQIVYGGEHTFVTTRDYTPFWTFSQETRRNLSVTYDAASQTLTFVNNDVPSETGKIQFGGGLIAGVTYNLVDGESSLQGGQARIVDITVNGFHYNSVGDINKKITVSKIGDLTIVEFSDATVKLADNALLTTTTSGILTF